MKAAERLAEKLSKTDNEKAALIILQRPKVITHGRIKALRDAKKILDRTNTIIELLQLIRKQS